MKNSQRKIEPSALRQEAEKLFKKKSGESYGGLSKTEALDLIQELEVHQIELELQKEELLQSRVAEQEAANKYIELYDFAPSGYVTLTPDGRVRGLNFSAAQMIGRERTYVIGVTFAFFISQDTRLTFSEFLERIFSNRVKEFCDVTLSLPDNLPMYVHLSGIATQKGDLCLVNVVDITERKQAEKAIMEMQRIKVIGEMASSVAHDFKNALQSISGNLELAMLNPDVPEAAMSYLRTVKTAVEDAAERVRLLQRFDGRTQEKAPYAYTDLNSLICEVIAQSRPLWKDEAEKKGLTIRIETSMSEIPEVLGNKEELRSVLYNILKNSIEALPWSGSIFVTSEKGPDGIYITITDTGMGMSEETQRRIFQPFYSTKGFDIGRGLGMSGALTILKEHGGNIRVKNSKPGEGTSIEIVLPYIKKPSDDENKRTEEKVVLDFKGPLQILWVEDDESIGSLVREMVTILGHEMDLAGNGIEALEYLEQKTYDLVITDIGMPGINGWELAEMIRQKFGGKIKVAIASGWGDQLNEEKKVAYGVSYVIDKPFGIAQIRELVEEVVPVIQDKLSHHNI